MLSDSQATRYRTGRSNFLTLDDCRNLALKNNLDLQVELIDEESRSLSQSQRVKVMPHVLVNAELSHRDNQRFAYSEVWAGRCHCSARSKRDRSNQTTPTATNETPGGTRWKPDGVRQRRPWPTSSSTRVPTITQRALPGSAGCTEACRRCGGCLLPSGGVVGKPAAGGQTLRAQVIVARNARGCSRKGSLKEKTITEPSRTCSKRSGS